MSYVDWMIRGIKVSACNCDYGCPCEFNAPPTYDVCEGLEASIIEEGYFGDVRLDGILFGSTYHWPGPLHEGGGIGQTIFDDRTSDAQRDALIKILSGEEQQPDTMFNVIAASSSITTWMPVPDASSCPRRARSRWSPSATRSPARPTMRAFSCRRASSSGKRR
jgi:hypothetical protein